jgi:hypothetical protein
MAGTGLLIQEPIVATPMAIAPPITIQQNKIIPICSAIERSCLFATTVRRTGSRKVALAHRSIPKSFGTR